MPPAELTPSELVDQALVLGKRHFVPLLLVGLPPILLAWELGHLARMSGTYASLSVWALLLGAYAAAGLADAAMVVAAWQALHAEPATIRTVWDKVGVSAVSVIVGYVWKALFVGFGIVLLIAPGLYLATSYFAIPGIFAIERVGFRAGFAHSRVLSASAMRLVFLSFTLFWLGTAIVTYCIPIVLRQFRAPATAFRVVPLLWFMIVAPFRAAVVARVYADRRAAKEGYDLDLQLAGWTSA